MRWVIPELNTRETAIVVWTLVSVVMVTYKAPSVWSTVGSLVRLVMTSTFLAALVLGGAAYMTAAVLTLKRLGYWNESMIKPTVLWFVVVGLVAAFNTKRPDAVYFERLLRQCINVAVVVEFVANLHAFPLPVELVFVLLVSAFVMTDPVTEGNPEYAPARTLIACCLILLGLACVSFSVAYVIGHYSEVVTAEKAKEFVLPLVLTASFVPFLYMVSVLLRRSSGAPIAA